LAALILHDNDWLQEDLRKKIQSSLTPKKVFFILFDNNIFSYAFICWGEGGGRTGSDPLLTFLLLGPPFFQLHILFLSTTLSTKMTSSSLHMQWPLTSWSHGSFLEESHCFFYGSNSTPVVMHTYFKIKNMPIVGVCEKIVAAWQKNRVARSFWSKHTKT
jgi:hypothetical protein